MKKPSNAKQSQMPCRIKTALFDEFAFPFPGNDSQIRSVVTFKGHTDSVRLLRAVRLAYDTEPILGCRFVMHRRNFYWQRLEHLDDFVPGRPVETDRMEDDVFRFLLAPMDPLTEPPLQVRLFRNDHDVLCLKLCHLASDAGGLKEIVYLIARLYEKLNKNPGYTPGINTDGDRSFRQIHKQFSLLDRMKIIRRGFLNWKSDTFPGKGWTFPLEAGDPLDRDLMFKRFDPKRFRALKAACASHDCTLHELFSAAILRTLHHIIEPPPETPLRLGTSVDLRRYLPRGEGESICNLSTFFQLNIGTDIGATFDDTLKHVKHSLRPLKKDYLGLGFYLPVLMHLRSIMPSAWARRLSDRMLRLNQCLTSGAVCPRLTNGGIIDETHLVFDGRPVSDCYFAPPVCHPPVFMPGLCGFGETLSLSIGFSGAEKNRGKVREFFNRLDEELQTIEGKDGSSCPG